MLLHRGKLAVLTMLGVAVLMAAFAWWWNYSRGQRCLAFYGSQSAALIRTAPKVEIVKSSQAGEASVIDISQAPGLLNARTSLLDDASFQWTVPPAAGAASDRQRVRFARGDREVTLLLDFGTRTITVESGGRAATLDEKTASGWQRFIGRHEHEVRKSGPPPKSAED
jgi:hypothetical protein